MLWQMKSSSPNSHWRHLLKSNQSVSLHFAALYDDESVAITKRQTVLYGLIHADKPTAN